MDLSIAPVTLFIGTSTALGWLGCRAFLLGANLETADELRRWLNSVSSHCSC